MPTYSIDFYDKSNGSVKISWDTNELCFGDAHFTQFMDTVLFGRHSLRQLRNLDGHPSAGALADELSNWLPPSQIEIAASEYMNGEYTITALPNHVMLRSALDMGMPYEAAEKQ
jgi:hypothetical protein